MYAKEAFADITNIHGVEGIYIASQQTSDNLELEEQQSVITYDKGASWQKIQAPEYGIGNLPLLCKVVSGGCMWCSVHLFTFSLWPTDSCEK